MADVAERPAGGEPEVDRENPLCRASRSRSVPDAGPGVRRSREWIAPISPA